MGVIETLSVTRRKALAGACASGAALLAACNAPQAPAMQSAEAAMPTATNVRIGSIRVDTSPVLAQLGNPTAAWAQQALSAQLPQVLAARMAPGKPGAATLAVVVNSINLGDGGPADPDVMTGAVTLDAGEVHMQFPVKAVRNWIPNPTDQALPEQAMQGRIQGLSVAFSYWVRRKMHL